MANRLYFKTKKLLKKYYLIILLIMVVFIVMMIPLPYIIESPGGLIDLDNKVLIKDKNKSKGSLNLTYVSQSSSNMFTYLMAIFDKNWDILKEEDNNENKTSKLLLDNAISNAEYVALNYLGKDINIKSTSIIVAYISPDAKTDLVIGDIILEVNNVKINSLSDYEEIVKNSKVGDRLVIKTTNKEKYVEVQENDKVNNTLIYIICNNTYDNNINYSFNTSESGSSGGLMTALSIYDKLTENDLTNGKIIAGTGTIDINGNVGEIDGIKYKIVGAASSGADVFLVPKENYIDAREIVKINHIDMKLVKVETFEDAIKYLNK